MRCVLAFVVAVSVSFPCLAAGKPLPEESAINAAKKLVAETYKKELAAADKAPAIKSMLELAAQTEGDDPAQAALYLGAAEVAARAGETRSAFDAVDQFARTFEVDALQSKATLLELSAKSAKTNDARVGVANRGLELADAAMSAGRMEIAESALKTAGIAAAKVRDADLRKNVVAKRKELEREKKHAERAESELAGAKKAIHANPDDPDANETLGKHFAFQRNDWPAGLKHLAKSGDQNLQSVAIADMKGAANGNQAAVLGDSWYALSESADSEHDAAGYRSRAAFWYSRAVSDLKGFAKSRIEKRIAEMQDAVAAAASQTGGDNGNFIDMTLAPGVILRLVKIPASRDGKIKEFYLGQTEVTQKQWTAIMGSNPSAVNGPNLPVGSVSIKDCERFLDKLNALSPRLRFRLPVESEFRFATLAGQEYGSIARKLAKFAWIKDNSDGKLHDVGQLSPNPWGLYDILGNSWEWMPGNMVWGGAIWQSASDFAKEPLHGAHDTDSDHSIGLRVAADPA